ncbi:unnamed protein product [Closterium sp. NIES-65]|nr:unnamed protein product [Closterium sp. NIES-65]
MEAAPGSSAALRGQLADMGFREAESIVGSRSGTGGEGRDQQSAMVLAAVAESIEMLRTAGSDADEKERVAMQLSQLAETSVDARAAIGYHAQAIPLLVGLVRSGTLPARTHAAATLGAICDEQELRVKVLLGGCIPPMLALLRNGPKDSQMVAAEALFAMSKAGSGRDAVGSRIFASEGVVPALLQQLQKHAGIHPDVLGLVTGAMRNLCYAVPGFWRTVEAAGGVEIFTSMLSMGRPATQENAAALLTSFLTSPYLAHPNAAAAAAQQQAKGKTPAATVAAAAAAAAAAAMEGGEGLEEAAKAAARVVEAGAIPPLLALLQPGREVAVRTEAAGALRAISAVHVAAREKIAAAGGVGMLIRATMAPSAEMMQTGYAQVLQENAMGALANIAGRQGGGRRVAGGGHCVARGLSNAEGKRMLVGLVTLSPTDAQAELVEALFNVCVQGARCGARCTGARACCSWMGAAGAVDGGPAGVRVRAARHPLARGGREQVGHHTAAGGIPPLVSLLVTGTAKAKEDAAELLGNLCSYNEDIRACVETADAAPALLAICWAAGRRGVRRRQRALDHAPGIGAAAAARAARSAADGAFMVAEVPESKGCTCCACWASCSPTRPTAAHDGTAANEALQTLVALVESEREETQESAAAVLANLFAGAGGFARGAGGGGGDSPPGAAGGATAASPWPEQQRAAVGGAVLLHRQQRGGGARGEGEHLPAGEAGARARGWRWRRWRRRRWRTCWRTPSWRSYAPADEVVLPLIAPCWREGTPHGKEHAAGALAHTAALARAGRGAGGEHPPVQQPCSRSSRCSPSAPAKDASHGGARGAGGAGARQGAQLGAGQAPLAGAVGGAVLDGSAGGGAGGGHGGHAGEGGGAQQQSREQQQAEEGDGEASAEALVSSVALWLLAVMASHDHPTRARSSPPRAPSTCWWTASPRCRRTGRRRTTWGWMGTGAEGGDSGGAWVCALLLAVLFCNRDVVRSPVALEGHSAARFAAHLARPRRSATLHRRAVASLVASGSRGTLLAIANSGAIPLLLALLGRAEADVAHLRALADDFELAGSPEQVALEKLFRCDDIRAGRHGSVVVPQLIALLTPKRRPAQRARRRHRPAHAARGRQQREPRRHGGLTASSRRSPRTSRSPAGGDGGGGGGAAAGALPGGRPARARRRARRHGPARRRAPRGLPRRAPAGSIGAGGRCSPSTRTAPATRRCTRCTRSSTCWDSGAGAEAAGGAAGGGTVEAEQRAAAAALCQLAQGNVGRVLQACEEGGIPLMATIQRLLEAPDNQPAGGSGGYDKAAAEVKATAVELLQTLFSFPRARSGPVAAALIPPLVVLLLQPVAVAAVQCGGRRGRGDGRRAAGQRGGLMQRRGAAREPAGGRAARAARGGQTSALQALVNVLEKPGRLEALDLPPSDAMEPLVPLLSRAVAGGGAAGGGAAGARAHAGGLPQSSRSSALLALEREDPARGDEMARMGVVGRAAGAAALPPGCLAALALGDLFQETSVALKTVDLTGACRALVALMAERASEDLVMVALCGLQNLVASSRANKRAVADCGRVQRAGGAADRRVGRRGCSPPSHRLRFSECATAAIPVLVGAMKVGSEVAQETALKRAVAAAAGKAETLLSGLPGSLSVCVKRGSNLKASMGATNAYCKLTLADTPAKVTKVVSGTCDPEWKQTFTWPLDAPPRGQNLHISCKNKGTIGTELTGQGDDTDRPGGGAGDGCPGHTCCSQRATETARSAPSMSTSSGPTADAPHAPPSTHPTADAAATYPPCMCRERERLTCTVEKASRGEATVPPARGRRRPQRVAVSPPMRLEASVGIVRQRTHVVCCYDHPMWCGCYDPRPCRCAAMTHPMSCAAMTHPMSCAAMTHPMSCAAMTHPMSCAAMTHPMSCAAMTHPMSCAAMTHPMVVCCYDPPMRACYDPPHVVCCYDPPHVVCCYDPPMSCAAMTHPMSCAAMTHPMSCAAMTHPMSCAAMTHPISCAAMTHRKWCGRQGGGGAREGGREDGAIGGEHTHRPALLA